MISPATHVAWWFTGSRIIQRTLFTAQATTLPSITNFPVLASPPVGTEDLRVLEDSADGNPGRPVRVADLLHLREKIGWFGFCSGPALKTPGRRIFPPDDMWKQRCNCTGDFTDKTVLFNDALGLPKSMEIFTNKGNLIYRYQVRQSTNVLGWNLPLEFYMVQYGPGRVQPPGSEQTNSWEVNLTAKGKVISVSLREQPSIREEAGTH